MLEPSGAVEFMCDEGEREVWLRVGDWSTWLSPGRGLQVGNHRVSLSQAGWWWPCRG
jgi:hypothetical protein